MHVEFASRVVGPCAQTALQQLANAAWFVAPGVSL